MKTEEDLNTLIKESIEEGTNLEYKDPRALDNKGEISKDISAMANSNGGTIIYGLCEDNKDHKPTRIEWLDDHKQMERIEQILQANVTPKIDIEINPIFNNQDRSKFILVLNVPKSDKAPHQDHSNKDSRFYWRRNGYTTRQMEHYEVEDLFFNRKRPALEIELVRRPTKNPSYDIIVHNKGKVLAEKIFIKLLVPQVFKISDPGWHKIKDSFTPQGHGCSEYHFIGEEFIYPELPNNMGNLFHPNEHYVDYMKLGFLIVCKDMEIKRGEIILGDGKIINLNYTKEPGTPYPEWRLKDGSYSIF